MTTGYQPFLVASQRTGVSLGMDPWLIPQDAYVQAINGYNFRGVLKKRDGYSWFDSVPHTLPGIYQNIGGITNGPNSIVTMTVPHGIVTPTFNVRFNGVTGLPSPGSLPDINGQMWVATVTGANTYTINNAQAFGGAYVGGTGTASYFPHLPVVCIAVWIDEQNASTLMVLDTRRASIFDGTVECLIPMGVTDQFTGAETDLFSWENYRGKIYFTNNKDSMFVYGNGGTFLITAGLQAFLPQYNGANAVTKCLLIKAIGSKLCLFNTQENGVELFTRIRWCQDGQEPYPGTGVGNVWDQITPGRGYFADVLDTSYILSLAKFQTNTFIFCRGQQFGTVYEMRPISDPRYAFAFVSVGTTRNFGSTFGTIVIDKIVTTVGDSGLIMTDGNNVSRYDDKIPSFVLDDMDLENMNRCFGQRNDRLWQTWLLYPSSGGTGRNDGVLVYNYQDSAWSKYTMDLSCLGTIVYPRADPKASDYDGNMLPDWACKDFGDASWASTLQSQAPFLMGGDYEGNLWWMDTGGGDAADRIAYNDPADDGQPIDFKLVSRQWFPYAKEGKSSQFGFVDLLVDGDVDTDVSVGFSIDNQSAPYATTSFTPVPFENILVAQIQNITLGNPTLIYAPDHQITTGDVLYVYGVQGTTQLNDNFYTATVIDSQNISLNVDSTTFSAYISGGQLSNQGLNQTPFWTRIYAGQTGVFHQMEFNNSGVDEDFSIHALILWMKPTGRIYR